MPEEPCTNRDADVTRFSELQADRERRERELLRQGLTAAADAIYNWTRPGQDVRIALVAMYGDPFAGEQERPERGQSVSVEARFISLDDARPLTNAQRRYLAIETMRAASPTLYGEMSLGLRLADVIEELAAAAEAGDEQAKASYQSIMAALAHAESTQAEDEDASRPDAPGEPSTSEG